MVVHNIYNELSQHIKKKAGFINQSVVRDTIQSTPVPIRLGAVSVRLLAHIDDMECWWPHFFSVQQF